MSSEERYMAGAADAAGWISKGHPTAEEVRGFVDAWDAERPVHIRVRDNHSVTQYLDQDRAPRTKPWETVVVVNPFTPYGRGWFEQMRTEFPNLFRFSDDEPAANR